MPGISNERPEGSSYGLKKDSKIDLYFECAKTNEEREVKVSLETLITLFVIKFSKCAEITKINVIFVDLKSEKDKDFTLKLEEEQSLIQSDERACQVSRCLLPAVHAPSKKLCVTGLCSVVRFLLKNACDQMSDEKEREDSISHKLLGYQGM